MSAHACGRCSFALEAEDLRCPLCGLGVPMAMGQTVASVRAEVLRCTECGAAMAYSAEAGAPKCAFCGSVTKLEALIDPVDQADWLLPFAVDVSTAHDMLRKWLGSRGFFRPSDLASASTVENLRPIWWPAWVFDARAEVSWTADSNAGARSSAWAPHAGRCGMDFQRVAVGASRGLNEGECHHLMSGYDLARAVAVAQGERGGPPGAQLERFDTQRSAARRRIVEALEATAAGRVQHGQVPGSAFRNVRVSLVLDGLTTQRYALPAYVLAYRYGKKLYRVVIHGQDPRIGMGEAPISWTKVALVVLGVLGVVAIIIAAAAVLSDGSQ